MLEAQDVNQDIEKAYPEAYRLARRFHELYEEAAPKFGYKTRSDTKVFEPASPNGRTMAYVCKEIVDEEVEKAHLTLLKDLKEFTERELKGKTYEVKSIYEKDKVDSITIPYDYESAFNLGQTISIKNFINHLDTIIKSYEDIK